MGKVKQFTHDDLLSDIVSMVGCARAQNDDEFTIDEFKVRSGLSDSVAREKINNLVDSGKLECVGYVKSHKSGRSVKAYRKAINGK